MGSFSTRNIENESLPSQSFSVATESTAFTDWHQAQLSASLKSDAKTNPQELKASPPESKPSPQELQSGIDAVQSYYKSVEKHASEADQSAALSEANRAWFLASQAVMDDLRRAANTATNPDKEIDERATQLIHGLPRGSWAEKILKDKIRSLEDLVLKESPAVRETNMARTTAAAAFQRADRAATAVDAASKQSRDAAEAESAAALTDKIRAAAQLGQAVATELNVEAATANFQTLKAERVPALELLELYGLIENARHGNSQPALFNEARTRQAVERVKANHRGEGLDKLIDTTADELRLDHEIKYPTSTHPALANDPVSQGLLNVLGKAGAEQGGLSSIEQDLDPILGALLSARGVRMTPTTVNTVKVTVGGQDVTLTEPQQQAAAAKDYRSLGFMLLAQAKLDERSSRLVAMAADKRPEYTRSAVQRLMENGDAPKAISVLKTNLDAALSGQERSEVWKTAGLPYFNESYFGRQFDKILGTRSSEAKRASDWQSTPIGADKIGSWVQRLVTDGIPSEMAGVLLTTMKKEFNRDWYASESGESLIAGPGRTWSNPEPAGEAFYVGAARLADVADRADPKSSTDFADWLMNSSADAPIAPMKHLIYGPTFSRTGTRLTSVPEILRNTIETGLSAKVLKHTIDAQVPAIRERFARAVDDAAAERQQRLLKDYARRDYEEFRKDPDAVVKPFFKSLLKGTDVTRPGRYEGAALRNMIGRSMGMIPTDQTAAEAQDESRNWYTHPDQISTIDVIERWIAENGGARPFVSAIPMKYADARQGVMNITLFEVRTPAGGTVLLDGSIAPLIRNSPPGTKPHANYIYKDFEDYRESNGLSSEGTLYVSRGKGTPVDFEFGLKRTPEGEPIYEAVQARVWTLGQKIDYLGQIVAGAGGVALGIAAAAPSGGSSLFVTWASLGLLGYGVGQSVYNLNDMYKHGQSMSLANPEARANYFNLVATAAGPVSAFASIRAGKLLQNSSNLTALAGEFERLPLAAQMRFTEQSGLKPVDMLLKSTAMEASAEKWRRGVRAAAALNIGIGAEMIGEQGYSLASSWDDMSNSQRAEAFFFFGLGVLGLGVGARSSDHQNTAPDSKHAAASAHATLREAQTGSAFDEGAGLSGDHGEHPDNAIHDHGVHAGAPQDDNEAALVASRAYFADGSEDSIFRNIAPPGTGRAAAPEKETPFWPNPDKQEEIPPSRRIINSLFDSFPRASPKYNREVYARMYEAADPRWQRILPSPESIKPDAMTVARTHIPVGLEEVVGDIHFHPYGYDRRKGQGFKGEGSLIDCMGKYAVVLSGSIPQHCGGAPHYSTTSATPMTTKNAQRLDDRAATLWLELAPKDQAKIHISITGMDFSRQARQPPADYIPKFLLKYPGVATAIGEITSHKEMVSIQLGPEAWLVTDKAYRDVLPLAAKTGLAIVLHCDWGRHGLNVAGRPAPAKSAYEYLPQLKEAHGLADLRSANVIFAHTGIGRFVRPNDAMVRRKVKVIDWDFENHRIRSSREKEIEVPDQIARMYELIEAVPNARFDMSWNDVTQAYLDSPRLREGLIQFIIDNPNRVLFGSDSVKPVNQGQYHQALKTAEPIFAELAMRDPKALWQVLRGNYEDVMDNAARRVTAWTERELEKQGRKADIADMRKRDEVLRGARANLERGAQERYAEWLDQLRKNWPAMTGQAVPDLGAEFEPRMGHNLPATAASEGVGAALYAALQEPQRQPWETDYRTGAGTAGGLGNQDRQERRLAAALAGLATGGSAFLADHLVNAITQRTRGPKGLDADSLMPGADLFNSAAFLGRGATTLGKALYLEKLRLDWEAIFENGKMTRQSLDRFVSRIFQAKSGFSSQQLLQVGAVAEQLYANYTYLRDLPVDEARGWNARQKFFHIMEAIGRAQIELDRIIGGSAHSLNGVDPRRLGGQMMRGLNLFTLMYNDAFSSAWLAANGLDFSTVESTARSSAAILFGLGNAALTAHTSTGLMGGLRGLHLETADPMRWLLTGSNYGLAAGGAAWTLADAIHAVGAFNSGHYPEAAIRGARAALAAAFTAGIGRAAADETAALLHRPVAGPRQLANPFIVFAGALVAAELLGVLLPPNDGELQQQPGAWTPPPADDAHDKGKPPYPINLPERKSTVAMPNIARPAASVPPTPRQNAVQPLAPARLAVIPARGANVRNAPPGSKRPDGSKWLDAGKRLAALPAGSTVTPTGRQQKDTRGRLWIEIEGPEGGNKGWVVAPSLRPARPAPSAQGDGGVQQPYRRSKPALRP